MKKRFEQIVETVAAAYGEPPMRLLSDRAAADRAAADRAAADRAAGVCISLSPSERAIIDRLNGKR